MILTIIICTSGVIKAKEPITITVSVYDQSVSYPMNGVMIEVWHQDQNVYGRTNKAETYVGSWKSRSCYTSSNGKAKCQTNPIAAGNPQMVRVSAFRKGYKKAYKTWDNITLGSTLSCSFTLFPNPNLKEESSNNSSSTIQYSTPSYTQPKSGPDVDISGLKIKCNVSGADIYLDGSKVGKTKSNNNPFVVNGLSTGPLEVKIRKTDYKDYIKSIEYKEGRPNIIEAKMAYSDEKLRYDAYKKQIEEEEEERIQQNILQNEKDALKREEGIAKQKKIDNARKNARKEYNKIKSQLTFDIYYEMCIDHEKVEKGVYYRNVVRKAPSFGKRKKKGIIRNRKIYNEKKKQGFSEMYDYHEVDGTGTKLQFKSSDYVHNRPLLQFGGRDSEHYKIDFDSFFTGTYYRKENNKLFSKDIDISKLDGTITMRITINKKIIFRQEFDGVFDKNGPCFCNTIGEIVNHTITEYPFIISFSQELSNPTILKASFVPLKSALPDSVIISAD